MLARFSPRRFFPLTVSQYALIFFVLLAIMLSGLISLMVHESASAQNAIRQSNEKAARVELYEAVAELNQFTSKAVQDLIAWDEARQQLLDPVYYGYWRNIRARSAGVLPASLTTADLYDRQGRNLSKNLAGAEAMPAKIDANRMGASLVNEGGVAYLYFFLPMVSDESSRQVVGYAGVKLEFLKHLRNLHNFRFVDTASVSATARDGEILRPKDIVPHLKFTLQKNPETIKLQQLLFNSLVRIGLAIAAASLVGYLLILSLLAHPLNRLSKHIDAMREGHNGVLPHNYRGVLPVAELENVRISLNDYQKRLEDMHDNLERKNDELWVLAHHDPLTGVFNRRAFEDDWEKLRARSGGRTVNISLLLFDCDHFKPINDTYGHQVGDQVIRGISDSLLAALRSVDRLYRLGGDEFATILFDTDDASAHKIAQRCIGSVTAHPFINYGIKEPVRISIGLAHTSDLTDSSLHTLQKQADLAMYYAKRPGQNKFVEYAATMSDDNQSLVSNPATNAVYEAIACVDLMRMHYQKIAKLPDGRVDYFEALVRIADGNGGLIMPSNIFPVVDARRLEVEFDLAVLKRILMDLEEGKIPEGTGVSINISGPGIINAEVNRQLLAYEPYMKRYKLVLEVTETALITQIGRAAANLDQLRKIGFVVALDDFGSGYSSLRYLANMPVDLVKFDISMVRCLEKRDRQSNIVENLARLIREAGYELVAEGIETQETLNKVIELGFSHAQGYFLGRPEELSSKRPHLLVVGS